MRLSPRGISGIFKFDFYILLFRIALLKWSEKAKAECYFVPDSGITTCQFTMILFDMLVICPRDDMSGDCNTLSAGLDTGQGRLSEERTEAGPGPLGGLYTLHSSLYNLHSSQTSGYKLGDSLSKGRSSTSTGLSESESSLLPHCILG